MKCNNPRLHYSTFSTCCIKSIYFGRIKITIYLSTFCCIVFINYIFLTFLKLRLYILYAVPCWCDAINSSRKIIEFKNLYAVRVRAGRHHHSRIVLQYLTHMHMLYKYFEPLLSSPYIIGRYTQSSRSMLPI